MPDLPPMFNKILPDPPAGGAFEPAMGTAESGTAGGPSGLEPIEPFETAGIQPFEADAGGIAPPPSVVGADELQLSPTLLDEIPTRRSISGPSTSVPRAPKPRRC